MQQQFGDFVASELYCRKCGSSQPVRERLLLVLPSGELHEYLCSRCGSSLGEREVSGAALKPAAVAPRNGAKAVPRRLLRG
jgi:DNA-directed RNA polymerase subunit RPC12/RpoP